MNIQDFINSSFCPKCHYRFPLLIRPSMRERRGIFSFPRLHCPSCGQICRVKLDWKSAIWAWPFTIVITGAMLYLMRNSNFFRSLRHYSEVLYGLSSVIVFIPLFAGLRRGFTLVKVEAGRKAISAKKKWLMVICLVVFLILLGAYTRNWSNVIIGLIVGFSVYGIFYYFSKKNA
jgi:hypothetical protein